VKAANHAGFDVLRFHVRVLEELHEIIWRLIIHMSSTGNAEKRSAISRQQNHGVGVEGSLDELQGLLL
jgi:hypothetical protein